MVYTVTLNPALDYVMRVGSLRYDDINRSQSEDVYYGGKGINVSVILTRLGIENKALGFVGGFTGDKLTEMLENDGIKCDFNRLKNGDTRINVKIKADTEILPGTIIKGKSVIGANCEIGPNSIIEDSVIGDNVSLNNVQCYSAEIKNGAHMGPFVRVRPGSVIGEGVKVGNFVEFKNSVIGDHTSVAHLTYIGDSDVGSGVNFGCGCATANYDGKSKARTKVGNNAFIGCDTCLVAPVQVGDNAYTAAGSVITDNVPDNALAIARAKESVKKDWVKKKKPYRWQK